MLIFFKNETYIAILVWLSIYFVFAARITFLSVEEDRGDRAYPKKSSTKVKRILAYKVNGLETTSLVEEH